MARILFFADYPMLIELARRLEPGAMAAGDHLVVCTNRLSCYVLGRRAGLEMVLVRQDDRETGLPDVYDERNQEVGSGYMARPVGRLVYRSFVHAGMKVIRAEGQPVDLILAWNGGLISSRAARSLSLGMGIPLLFMEIANIRGRMLFDPDGSACDTSVARRPELLDNYPIDEAAGRAWIDEFIASRRRSSTVPQAKGFRKPNYWFALDLFGRFFNAAPGFSVGPWHRVRNILLRRKFEKAILARSTPRLPDEPFVFLPLQVSTDTNLICRSEIDNFGAIERGLGEARARGAVLVIKLHPAEREGYFLEKLLPFLEAHPEIIVTTANTIEAIDRSVLVMTINSTVGLEARLLGKETMVLQPAHYTLWDNAQIARFALAYTVPFDMYSTDLARADQWREIRARIVWPAPPLASAA